MALKLSYLILSYSIDILSSLLLQGIDHLTGSFCHISVVMKVCVHIEALTKLFY